MKKIDELIVEKTISDIQKALLRKELTCLEVVRFYLDRHDRLKEYNTVININPAIEETARQLDEKLSKIIDQAANAFNEEEQMPKRLVDVRNKIGHLFGTVVLLKDNIAVANMPTTAGALVINDLRTTRDAFYVKQLKKEGVLILGKTNLSEWANFMSEPSSNGFSVVGGQTKNSFGEFDAGGSSSGSAVSASLNLTMVSVGSETCGSLVYPASQNAIVTLKPTVGLISRDLVIPITEAQDTLGPMGRCVADVWELMKVSVEYDPNDPQGKSALDFDRLEFEKPLDLTYLNGKKIGFLKQESERASSLRHELKSLGATIVDIDIDQEHMGIDMMSVLNYGIKEDVKSFFNHKDVVSPVKSLEEVVTYNKKNSKVHMPFGQKLFEDALKDVMEYEEYVNLVNNNERITRMAIDNCLAEHNLTALVSFSNDLSMVYAAARYPAVTVPAGYKLKGEPYGVTFVGSYNDDAKLLRIAYAYEKGTLHRKNPINE